MNVKKTKSSKKIVQKITMSMTDIMDAHFLDDLSDSNISDDPTQVLWP